jgi:hypothetical protein
MKKTKKTYCIIAKVDNVNFVKYRANDLNNVFIFLKNKFPSIRYANVFSNKGINENKLLYTWGKNKGLQPAY